MATGGKLLRAMVVTALWLSAVEGVMAAGRRQIALPNQETPEELGLLPDLSGNSTGSSLDMEPSPSQLTLALPQTLTQADLRLTEANRLLDLGIEESNRSQFREAIASWERALELYRAVGDRVGEVRVLSNLGNVYSNLGQYERAIDFYQQQLAIAREIGDRAGEGDALGGLGVAYRNLGQYDRTLEQYGQAVVLFNELVAPSETAALLEVEGQLEDGDEVLQDGSLYDLHTFEGQAGQLVEIRLDSDDFNAYLILVGPDGETVAADDGGGEGLNALITIQLPQTGRYSVIANAHDASGQGRYQLTVVAISAEDYQRGQERASGSAEADQLIEHGIEQFNRSQFREALASWERALELYRAAGNRTGEGGALSNLGNVYNRLGQYERAIDFYEQSLEIAREIGDLDGESGALNNLGIAYRNLGQYERAIDFYEQHLVLFREIGDLDGESLALNNLGNVYNRLGQYERAIDFYEQSLEIACEIGDRTGQGRALGNLGIAYRNLGQYERAIDFHEQSLVLLRELGDLDGESRALNNLGNAYDSLGQYERAIDFYEQSLVLLREIGDRAGEGVALGNLGNAYDSLGQYERAIDLYEQHLAIARELGDLDGESRALNNLGNVYNSLGQYERTIDFYEQSLVLFRELGDLDGESRALNNLGIAYDRLGQYERAIDFHEQHLAIANLAGDHAGEGRALGNLGVVYRSLGQYEHAIDFHEQHLAIAREIGDRTGEGRALGNLGNAYYSLGQYERAINFSEQSLVLLREIGDRAGEGSVLGGLSIAYNRLGQYERAIDFLEQSRAIAREIGNRVGEGHALGNLGNVYHRLGQYQRAIDFYEQSLVLFREIGDRAGEGSALGNLGNVYFSLGQYERAIDFYEQWLAIAREIGDRAGEGSALGNLGVAYDNLGQYERAIDFHEQSLVLFREIGDRAGEGSALGNLGNVYFSLGQYERALEQYGQAVALFNEIGARDGAALFLNNIGILLTLQNQPELAITFLKAGVDLLEAIRGDIRSLDTDLQQSFTDTVADDYRLLADLLLQQDRVLEAQEVLDLLKLQELEDYQIRNVRGTEETRQGLSFWQPEREIIDRFYTHLETHTDPQTFFTSTAITERVAQLQRNARSQNPNPEQLARLQGNLQQAGNAALLYPLVLDDRLELVLVTTTGISRHTVPVTRVQLNRVIAAFRSDILDPFSNPHPNAQQLYQWLIAPLTEEIDRAGAETILYAADGQLRYIPLAALHDGDQWLTQRYTVNHITAASLMDFSQSQAAPLSILAGAFPAEDLAVEVAGVPRYFNGLPYAQVEVENLQDDLPGTVAFFSAGFNRQAIEPRLGDHTIIHLATHGTFQSGHPNDSFILLGDGDRITLFDLDQWELPNAALVVLSACETAVSGPELGTGAEILGFGYQIQRTGARAAIASLWVVSDGGTQVLMNGFYGAMQLGLPKAEALRQAQMALITGDYTAVGGRRGDIEIRGGRRQSPMGDPLAHPYYWAPFILIGNGL